MSPKRVARLMRQNGLDARPNPNSMRTTQSNHDRGYAPNVLERNFQTETLNQTWVGDITYVRTDEGWLYLATLLDLFSRRIVGWAMRDSLHDELATAALQSALSLRGPSTG